MKRLNKILVPTDLSENSRRALSYACWLAGEENAALVALHVASDLPAWEYFSDECALAGNIAKRWPVDRVLAEASLDLSRFLEPSLPALKKTGGATRRVVLGKVARQIVAVAEEEKADLIVMSPRRRRGLKNFFHGGVTELISRSSPCPVLSIAAPLPTAPWRGHPAFLPFKWPRQRTARI
jgi:nucleotide-binding universal stress UspA family protein